MKSFCLSQEDAHPFKSRLRKNQGGNGYTLTVVFRESGKWPLRRCTCMCWCWQRWAARNWRSLAMAGWFVNDLTWQFSAVTNRACSGDWRATTTAGPGQPSTAHLQVFTKHKFSKVLLQRFFEVRRDYQRFISDMLISNLWSCSFAFFCFFFASSFSEMPNMIRSNQTHQR